MTKLTTIVTVAAIIATGSASAVLAQGSTGSGGASPGSSTTAVSPNRGTGSSGPTVPGNLDAGTPTVGNGSGGPGGVATTNEGANGTIPNGAVNPAAPPAPGAGSNPSTTPN
jgi:hypothetical protein